MNSRKKFAYTAAIPAKTYIKIGVTGNPVQRFRSYKTLAPDCEFTVFFHSDAENIERMTKKKFSSCHLSGENYSIKPEEVHKFYDSLRCEKVSKELWEYVSALKNELKKGKNYKEKSKPYEDDIFAYMPSECNESEQNYIKNDTNNEPSILEQQNKHIINKSIFMISQDCAPSYDLNNCFTINPEKLSQFFITGKKDTEDFLSLILSMVNNDNIHQICINTNSYLIGLNNRKLKQIQTSSTIEQVKCNRCHNCHSNTFVNNITGMVEHYKSCSMCQTKNRIDQKRSRSKVSDKTSLNGNKLNYGASSNFFKYKTDKNLKGNKLDQSINIENNSKASLNIEVKEDIICRDYHEKWARQSLQEMGYLSLEKNRIKEQLWSKPAREWKFEDMNIFFNRYFELKDYNCESDPRLLRITGEQYFLNNLNDLRYFCVFQHPISIEETLPLLTTRDVLERNTYYKKIFENYQTLRCNKEWSSFEKHSDEEREVEKKRKAEYEDMVIKNRQKHKRLQEEADEINRRRGNRKKKKVIFPDDDDELLLKRIQDGEQY